VRSPRRRECRDQGVRDGVEVAAEGALEGDGIAIVRTRPS
jgi:hypothetical protein